MESENSILKIYVSNTDHMGMTLLYEYIVLKAHKKGISGVTAYRGITGYGLSNNRIVTSKFWEITDKLPVIVEMIDKTEILESFYNEIENDIKAMGKGCLIYIQPIEIKLHQSGKKKE